MSSDESDEAGSASVSLYFDLSPSQTRFLL